VAVKATPGQHTVPILKKISSILLENKKLTRKFEKKKFFLKFFLYILLEHKKLLKSILKFNAAK
jgi:hypothetical protein